MIEINTHLNLHANYIKVKNEQSTIHLLCTILLSTEISSLEIHTLCLEANKCRLRPLCLGKCFYTMNCLSSLIPHRLFSLSKLFVVCSVGTYYRFLIALIMKEPCIIYLITHFTHSVCYQRFESFKVKLNFAMSKMTI